jgi:hypothetical protein
MKIRKSEPIQLVARTYGYFPASFRWRGRRFEVLTVEKCWSDSGPIVQRTFRVRCQAGRFILQQDVGGDRWRVTRWPLTLWWPHVRRVARPRFPLPRHQRRPAVTSRAATTAPVHVRAHAAAPAAKPRGEIARSGALPARLGAPVPARVAASSPHPRRNQPWTASRQRS